MSGDRQPLTWLVSYPKSGNTWFRFIIFHLVHGRLPENSRELDEFLNSRPRLRPTDRFKKSHANVSTLSAKLEPQDKVIYIHRHPLDVLQSAANYAVLTGEISIDDRPQWIDAYIENGGHPLWFLPPFEAGPWSENISGWVSSEAAPTLIISYEAALSDPLQEIRRLAKFLSFDLDEATLLACAERTTFEALRAFEESELNAARKDNEPKGRFSDRRRLEAADDGVRFFNKGSADAWRDTLDKQQAQKAWTRFKDVAELLGYSI